MQASSSSKVQEFNTPRRPDTHKAVQCSGVIHELLTEGSGAEGLHTFQADSPQETLLQQGRG